MHLVVLGITILIKECYNLNMKLMRSLLELPLWQKAIIVTVVVAVPAGVLLGSGLYKWFTRRTA